MARHPDEQTRTEAQETNQPTLAPPLVGGFRLPRAGDAWAEGSWV